MSSGLLAVRPATFDMSAAEKQYIAFDFDADLAESEIIVSATATLVEKRENVAYSSGLLSSCVINPDGKSVAQWVYQLVPGKTYSLRIEVTTSTGRELQPELIVRVPY